MLASDTVHLRRRTFKVPTSEISPWGERSVEAACLQLKGRQSRIEFKSPWLQDKPQSLRPVYKFLAGQFGYLIVRGFGRYGASARKRAIIADSWRANLTLKDF